MPSTLLQRLLSPQYESKRFLYVTQQTFFKGKGDEAIHSLKLPFQMLTIKENNSSRLHYETQMALCHLVE